MMVSHGSLALTLGRLLPAARPALERRSRLDSSPGPPLHWLAPLALSLRAAAGSPGDCTGAVWSPGRRHAGTLEHRDLATESGAEQRPRHAEPPAPGHRLFGQHGTARSGAHGGGETAAGESVGHEPRQAGPPRDRQHDSRGGRAATVVVSGVRLARPPYGQASTWTRRI